MVSRVKFSRGLEEVGSNDVFEGIGGKRKKTDNKELAGSQPGVIRKKEGRKDQHV